MLCLKKIPPEDIKLTQLIVGGAKVTFEVPNNYVNYDKITFFTGKEDVPDTVLKLGDAISHVDTCSEKNQALLQPKFS